MPSELNLDPKAMLAATRKREEARRKLNKIRKARKAHKKLAKKEARKNRQK